MGNHDQPIDHPADGYKFLPGIEPYSCGVASLPGFEIVHVRLSRRLPWLAGLHAARKFLEGAGLTVQRLCAVELRCPAPHPMDGFLQFNAEYRGLLEKWGMLVDDLNPVARTNVAPVVRPPEETMLSGFSYCRPAHAADPDTFVIAGGGELPEGPLDATRIIRRGESSGEAMQEKARCVVGLMNARLQGLGVDAEDVSTINVYTAHPLRSLLVETLIPGLSTAAETGVCWRYSRPPVEEIEFEMDLRGVRTEVLLDLRAEPVA